MIGQGKKQKRKTFSCVLERFFLSDNFVMFKCSHFFTVNKKLLMFQFSTDMCTC